MKEYFQNPSANESTFSKGWFQSGDEGFFKIADDGKKYFFITGRLKELFIRGGVNISPLEIDEVINKAPGVKAGISVGFENDMYGEEIGALIIPTDEYQNEKQLLEYFANELPFHKRPKVIICTEVLPVTSTGKYQRNKVKHLFQEFKSAQFRK
jgi:long-chain acyl-CoA synthetase